MEKNINLSRLKLLALILITLLVGFAVGLFFASRRDSLPDDRIVEETRQSTFNKADYQFIDPLLGCSVATKKDVAELASLKNKINNLINEKIAAKQTTAVSVYFDTRDGNWLSINPNEQYSPASLMKVPVAVAWLKEAETKPELLVKKIIYDGKVDTNKTQNFPPAKTLIPGTAYTVDDLIFRMLAYSDNNAFFLLINNIKEDILNEVCSDLGVNIPPDLSDAADFMTVKQYANFFRVLYNASYLNRDMSEKALINLSHNGFIRGLAAGLPVGFKLSEKFGEHSLAGYELNDPANKKELHDCGIIYYPNHPYLLCVMTKGNDFNNLAGVISSISKSTYDFMAAKYSIN